MKKNSSVKHLIYINSVASLLTTNRVMKKFLNEKLRGKNWICFDEGLETVPDSLDLPISNDYYHGVAISQFTMMAGGGTFINPLIAGLSTNFNQWAEAIHDVSSFNQTVLYVDVPYDVYFHSITDNKELPMEEEDYKAISRSMVNLVTDLQASEHMNKTIH